MAHTQSESRREIEEHIRVRELVKQDLSHLLKQSTSKIERDYLREKIRDINTDLRVFTKIHHALTRTIRQCHKGL